MDQIEPLFKIFGPTGAILALGIAALRAVWPWLRDVYLPGRLAAVKQQADAWTRIADLAERNHQQLIEVRQDIADVRQDIAALYERGRQVRPSRRAIVAGAAAEGAS